MTPWSMRIAPLLSRLGGRPRPNPRCDAGQGMTEYGVIMALIAAVTVLVLEALGGSITDIWTVASDAVAAAVGD